MAKYNVEDFRDWGMEREVRAGSGRYVLARPENYKFDGLWHRIKIAFLVLVGRYDAIEWADGQ
jgi:hypothetical protein